MDGKTRFFLAVTMSAVMVFMVTLITSLINLGLPRDFLLQWAKAYAVAWPVAAATAYLIMPAARLVTERIVGLIDGKA